MTEKVYSNGSLDWHTASIIWTAGFWEGEGSCGIYPSNYDYKRLSASACQTDESPIRKIQEMFGGAVGVEYRSEQNRRPIWTWTIGNTKGWLFLKTIRPFVVSKYKQEQIDDTLLKWEVYRTEYNKTKYVTKREKNSDLYYQVRIPSENGTVYVGNFRDPEVAYLAMMERIGNDAMKSYDLNKK